MERVHDFEVHADGNRVYKGPRHGTALIRYRSAHADGKNHLTLTCDGVLLQERKDGVGKKLGTIINGTAFNY